MLRKCVPDSFLPYKQWTWMLQPWQHLLLYLSRIFLSVFLSVCLSIWFSVCLSVCVWNVISLFQDMDATTVTMLAAALCLVSLCPTVCLSVFLCLSVWWQYLAKDSLAEIMAAEELVPDILAIVAARLKEQVKIKVWPNLGPDLSLTTRFKLDQIQTWPDLTFPDLILIRLNRVIMTNINIYLNRRHGGWLTWRNWWEQHLTHLKPVLKQACNSQTC